MVSPAARASGLGNAHWRQSAAAHESSTSMSYVMGSPHVSVGWRHAKVGRWCMNEPGAQSDPVVAPARGNAATGVCGGSMEPAHFDAPSHVVPVAHVSDERQLVPCASGDQSDEETDGWHAEQTFSGLS